MGSSHFGKLLLRFKPATFQELKDEWLTTLPPKSHFVIRMNILTIFLMCFNDLHGELLGDGYLAM